MKILQIQRPGLAELIDMEDPVAGPGQVVIRVEAIASCPHWDITMMTGRDIFDRPGFPRYPAVPGQPGHEMTGVVESVGAGVTDYAPGDPAIVWRTMGEGKLGYYAEKACVKVEDLLPRPEGLSAADTAGFEMAMCMAGAFLALPDLHGLRISIGGLGPAGLIAVQMAREAGAGRVIGFDLLPDRRDMALKLGADQVLDPETAEGKRLTEEQKGSVDYAIDCSGNSASTEFQMDLGAKAVVLFGVVHDPFRYQGRHWLAGLSIYSPFAHSDEAAKYAMRSIESRAVRLAPLNTVELPLSRFSEGTTLLAERRALKVLYRPG